MKIKLLSDAENDIENGMRFYESQTQGLGSYFLDSILADIDSLYVYAGIHMVISSYHRLLSKRFPFAIYYKVDEEIVYVYAILDCRRKPSWIVTRLANR